MSIQLMASGEAYHKLKVNREENLTKYAESVDAYVKKAEKIGKSNDEKGGEQKGKARSTIENEKMIFFPFRFL